MSGSALCLAFVAAMLAGPASATELRLEISNELVTIVASEIPLRSVAGYLAAPRRVGGTGASQYESVMILATSTPPATIPPAAAARGQVNPVIRTIPPQLEQQQVMPDDGDQIGSDHHGRQRAGAAPADARGGAGRNPRPPDAAPPVDHTARRPAADADESRSGTLI